MESKKITKPLIFLSIIAIVFNLARLDAWGTTNLLYLIWNLFLAWVPYIISLFLIKKDTRIRYFIPVFFVWILFFPNAMYLVTDVFHVVSSSPASLWYDSLLLFFFGWVGLFLGMLSLFHVHQYLKAHLNYFFSEVGVFLICLVSSFGVYLGRFERWNSWDVFLNPTELVKNSFNVSTNLAHTGTPLIFVVVFTVFIYSVYRTMYVFLT
ncbi:MAG: DUF1361 domain-containing protein [Candidatus Pacebacteria bacterium]|nr:DUF1361 domain-containing protein [Candidatus Paceibacterota bacterium]